MVIIDTNFLLKDYKGIELIEDDILIPITVIYELDKKKNDDGYIGYNARKSLRIINDAIDNNNTLCNGKKISIDKNKYDSIQKPDDKIIQTAVLNPECTLITGDLGMKITATSLNLNVKAFIGDDGNLNPGLVEEIEIDYDLLQDVFNNGKIHFSEIQHPRVHYNSCFLLRDEAKTGSALVRRIGDYFVKITQPKNVFGKINGKNVCQRLYLDMLLDPKIKIILVNGVAGSGKTLLALAAACQLRESRKFEDIICAKSVEEVGKEIGFRPGEEINKLHPYYAAFDDNLEFLASSEVIGAGLKRVIPEVIYEHIGYMRGRTFRNSFIIVDECQNLTPKEIKTVLSRPGENSKIVCCGDLSQIDNNQSEYTNGLFHAQRKLIGNEIVGVISLTKSERSGIAKLSSLL